MTLLPIVERELRVASRQRSHYRGRLIVAALTVSVGAVVYWSNRFQPPPQVGQFLFVTLSALVLFSCLLSGTRFTADALSSEHREGTLGLLFLTDLKGYDVVLGKLTAAAVPAVFALMAALPVLVTAVLFGGVPGSAVWRMALALLAAVGFTLALGMAVSVWFRDARKALLVTGALTMWLAAGPWLAPAWTFGGNAGGWSLGVYVSPIAPYVAALVEILIPTGAPGPFGAKLDFFWPSLAGLSALATALLVVASLALQRSWHEHAGFWCRVHSRLWGRWTLGRANRETARRAPMLDDNPYSWVLLRKSTAGVGMWCVLAALGAAAVYGALEWGSAWAQEGGNLAVSLTAHLALRCGLALAVVHRLGDDRRSGALELLLVTPRGGQAVLSGQMQAMRRLFGGPAAAVIVVDLLFAFLQARDFFSSPVLGLSFLFGRLVLLIADCVALAWLGTWLALRSGSSLQATSAALGRVLVFPWCILLGMLTTVHLLGWESKIGDEFALGSWFVVGIANSVFWAGIARRRLAQRLGAAEDPIASNRGAVKRWLMMD